jgi:hypothetical protein
MMGRSMVGVVHLDGAKGSVAWAKRNAEASNLGQAKIRWLCEDVTTFIDREIKRGSRWAPFRFCYIHRLRDQSRIEVKSLPTRPLLDFDCPREQGRPAFPCQHRAPLSGSKP